MPSGTENQRGPRRQAPAGLRVVALLAPAVLALSGCIRSTTTIVVADDGSGTAELLITVDAAAVSQASGGDLLGLGTEIDPAATTTVPPEQVCDQVGVLAVSDQLPPEAVSEPYEADGFCGQRISFPFATADELATDLSAVTGGDTELASGLLLTPGSDGGWTFESPVLTVDETDLAAAGVPAPLGQTVLATAEVTYVVTLPGTAVEGASNADEIEGGTFRWFVDLAEPPALLTARTAPGGTGAVADGGDGSPPFALIGAVLATVALVGAIGFLVVRRRSRPADLGPVAWDQVGHWDGATPVGGRSGRRDPGSGSSARGRDDEPWWDEEWGVWLAEDPDDGTVYYDEDTDRWLPI